MSQSDFLIRAGASNNGDQYTGSAVLNNTLSNPLSSSDNCRVLNEDNDNSGYQIRGIYLVTSSLSGGMFVNIDETKSVSLRVWGRITNGYLSQRVSLLAKHNGYNIADHDTNAEPATGYEFGYEGGEFYGGGTGRLFYKFEGYKASSGNTSNVLPGYTQDLGLNKWVGLRMDISPVRINKIVNGTPVSGTFKDIVKFYTASYDAPDTWTQVGSTQEITADGNYFVPWGSYSATGSPYRAGTVSTSSYGFSVSSPKSTNVRTYFDDFQIIVEDAF